VRTLLLAVILALSLLGCSSSADAVPTKLPEPPKTVPPTQTPRPTPTLRPAPPTSVPAVNTPTPVPATPALEPPPESEASDKREQAESDSNAQTTGGEAEELLPTATPVPTPVIEPTVRPTPTPRWRPAPKPQGVTGYKGFNLTAGPVIRNNVLSMSAVIDNHSVVPSEVQVWQSLRRDDNGGKCPTEKPIALIADGAAGGTSQIQWEYCSYLGSKPFIEVDSVPWLSGAWSYEQRTRRRLTEPLIADWSMSVSLANDLVEDLEYSRPEGYTIVVFADNLLLAKVWLDY
jgi:hypothetical protein